MQKEHNKCILPDLGKLSPFLQKRRKKAATSPKPQMQALCFFREYMNKVVIVILALLSASCATQHTGKASECVKRTFKGIPYKAEAIPLTQYGIGASIQKRDGKFYISKIVPGGPASLNSFREGEQILSISARNDGDFESVENMKLEELVYEIRGCKLAELAFKIRRNDKIITLTAFRERIYQKHNKAHLVPR
jgi:predicted metalloprotease with PDZ domain